MNSLVPSGDNLADQTKPLDFKNAFTVALPPRPNSSSPETDNREAMYELRKLIEQSAPDSGLAWLPQALEAFLRSRQSDFVPDFGHIRGLQIDRHAQRVRLLTQGEQTGAFDLSFEDLRPYSLELQLKDLEGEQPVTPIPYSAEMAEAVKHLPESARYRWDLITRAARYIAMGHGQTPSGNLRVSPVGPDMLSYPHGIGVFLDREPRSRFSILKVTDEEVPLTEREQALESMILGAASANSLPPALRDYIRGVWDAMNFLEKKYPDLAQRSGHTRMEDISLWMRRANVSLFKHTSEEYAALQVLKAYEQLSFITDYGAGQAGLMDLFREKGKYREQRPFECTGEDRTEGLERVQKELDRLQTALKNFAEVMAKHREVILQALPTEFNDWWNQKRMEQARGSIEGSPPALPNPR